MVKKIVLISTVIIVAITLSFYVIFNDQNTINESYIIEKEISEKIPIVEEKTLEEINIEIDNKYSEIELNKEEYTLKTRNWPTSGPFKIDRSEYALGEKIFLITENLDFDEKGEIIFLRTLNATHYAMWKTFPFDGVEKTAFNIYFEPRIQKQFGICSKQDLIGEWKIYFKGVEYKPISFKIIDEILPGEEEKFNKTAC